MTQIYLKYYLLRSKECTVPLPSRDGTGNGTSSTSRGVFDDGEVSGRQALCGGANGGTASRGQGSAGAGRGGLGLAHLEIGGVWGSCRFVIVRLGGRREHRWRRQRSDGYDGERVELASV
jgi:hypothetical protein